MNHYTDNKNTFSKKSLFGFVCGVALLCNSCSHTSKHSMNNNDSIENDEKSHNNNTNINIGTSNHEQDNLVDKYLEVLTEATENSKNYKKVQNAVLILGPTGCGKSTTINYLLGHKMKLSKIETQSDDTDDEQYPGTDDDEVLEGEVTSISDYVIEVDKTSLENIPVAGIGHENVSHTLYPASYNSEKDDLCFCDCPGFFDNRSEEKLFATAIANNMLIRDVKKIKAIIIANSHNSLTDSRGTLFIEGSINAMKNTFKIYKSEYENYLKNSLKNNKESYTDKAFSTFKNVFTTSDNNDNIKDLKKNTNQVEKEQLNTNTNHTDPLKSVFFLFTKVPKKMKNKAIWKTIKKIKDGFKNHINEAPEKYKFYISFLNRVLKYNNILIVRPLEEEPKTKNSILKALKKDSNKIDKDEISFIGGDATLEKINKFGSDAVLKLSKPMIVLQGLRKGADDTKVVLKKLKDDIVTCKKAIKDLDLDIEKTEESQLEKIIKTNQQSEIIGQLEQKLNNSQIIVDNKEKLKKTNQTSIESFQKSIMDKRKDISEGKKNINILRVLQKEKTELEEKIKNFSVKWEEYKTVVSKICNTGIFSNTTYVGHYARFDNFEIKTDSGSHLDIRSQVMDGRNIKIEIYAKHEGTGDSNRFKLKIKYRQKDVNPGIYCDLNQHKIDLQSKKVDIKNCINNINYINSNYTNFDEFSKAINAKIKEEEEKIKKLIEENKKLDEEILKIKKEKEDIKKEKEEIEKNGIPKEKIEEIKKKIKENKEELAKQQKCIDESANKLIATHKNIKKEKELKLKEYLEEEKNIEEKLEKIDFKISRLTKEMFGKAKLLNLVEKINDVIPLSKVKDLDEVVSQYKLILKKHTKVNLEDTKNSNSMNTNNKGDITSQNNPDLDNTNISNNSDSKKIDDSSSINTNEKNDIDDSTLKQIDSNNTNNNQVLTDSDDHKEIIDMPEDDEGSEGETNKKFTDTKLGE